MLYDNYNENVDFDTSIPLGLTTVGNSNLKK